MSEKSSSSTLKIVGFIALVFVVGVGGVLAGHLLKSKLPRFGKPDVTMPAPTSLLNKGAEFPDVAVADRDGTTRQTGELIGAAGCVVLFLDLDCPPCEDMTARWQRAYDKGVVAYDQLWAVTYYPRAEVDAYIDRHGVTFPVLVDTARTFMYEYEVKRFPMEVVVGASGIIRAASYDSASPIDEGRLADWLAD
jgi:peroxiredoxin